MINLLSSKGLSKNSFTQYREGFSNFLKHFKEINNKYSNNYLLKSPKGKSNIYCGENKRIWFYHKYCNRFFQMTPSAFCHPHKKYNKYKCSLCSKEYAEKMVSKTDKKACKNRVMMTKSKARKIKKINLHKGYEHFLKKFKSMKHSDEYELKAPKDHKEKYTGNRCKLWFYHKLCKSYTCNRPDNIFHGFKNNDSYILCKKCKKILRNYFTYNKSLSVNSNYIQKMRNHGYNISMCKNRKYYDEKHKIYKNKKCYKTYRTGRRRYSNLEFRKRVFNQFDNRNHTYVPLDKYKGNMKMMRWLVWLPHRESHVIKLTPNEFLNQNVRDKNKIHFIGEDQSMKYLNYYGLAKNIDYFHSYIFHTSKNKSKCLHADIFLPSIKYSKYYNNGIAIEYDGIQHFQIIDFGGKLGKLIKNHDSRKKIKHYKKYLINNYKSIHYRDIKKAKYCYKNHIKLISIRQTSKKHHNKAYVRRLVFKTLNKELLPALYRNYLYHVDMKH